jgi:WD40 repeat protein
VRHARFSPSGSQLAFCINNKRTRRTAQNDFHIWDRWGKETLLEGHTEHAHCLEYSLDGEHLASGGGVGWIRIWHTESFHTITSKPLKIPTQIPKQADAILVGTRGPSTVLSFSRTDSNLLASGGLHDEIKVWNIKERACIHSFTHGRVTISALFFAGGADIACLAAARSGSVIRLWRAEGSSDLSSEIMGEADQGGTGFDSATFSPSGSFLAAIFTSRIGNWFASKLELYELEAMTETQFVVMPGFNAACVAVSPDSKQLVYDGGNGRIRLLQADDFSIQRDLDVTGEAVAVSSVAFDPSCQCLALGYLDGRLELRSL